MQRPWQRPHLILTRWRFSAAFAYFRMVRVPFCADRFAMRPSSTAQAHRSGGRSGRTRPRAACRRRRRAMAPPPRTVLQYALSFLQSFAHIIPYSACYCLRGISRSLFRREGFIAPECGGARKRHWRTAGGTNGKYGTSGTHESPKVAPVALVPHVPRHGAQASRKAILGCDAGEVTARCPATSTDRRRDAAKAWPGQGSGDLCGKGQATFRRKVGNIEAVRRTLWSLPIF